MTCHTCDDEGWVILAPLSIITQGTDTKPLTRVNNVVPCPDCIEGARNKHPSAQGRSA